ncbi:MAG: family glycosyltransferase, 4-amino-4-deoxy-L-arabinose transferase [Acidobacteria bacterium]|nr:family glycosyltransferase, 4-amino-4-deoxy-L-arabinose transferase [Acidobacteriota bacterium]
MQNFNSKNRLHSIVAVIAVSIFFALTIASSLTHRPQIDEGMFASPAYNLASEGYLGTTVLETEKSPLTRIEQRTYWVMPLYLLNTAASFKILGFSLFSMRFVNVLWGFGLLLAWYFIILKLTDNKNTAILCLILLACDYTVLDTSAAGRMDMMSASLGFIGIAAFLLLRERNLTLAVLLSQTFVAASGLTHPNGVLAFSGLAFLTFYFEFARLRLVHLAVALIPYLIGGTAFGIWVLQDYTAFKDQFIDNALMSGRMKGVSSPWSSFIREFTEKYPHAFGLAANSGGHSGPIYLKSLILLGYVVGVFGVLFTKSLRRNYLALLITAAIYFVVMALIDGQKQTPYLIHIVPFYTALLAIYIIWLWEKRIIPVPILAAGLCFFLALQTGGMALRIKQNTYGNFYQPTVDYLKINARENDVIMASADFGFGLNFPDNLLSDGRFAYYTHKRPRYIVYDDQVKTSWEESKIFFPEFYDYLPRLLQEEYKIVYENAAFKIYEKR